MEKIYYELKPFAFLFAGLKSMTLLDYASSNFTMLAFLFAGGVLTYYSYTIFVSRWRTRGYFGLKASN